MGRQIEMETEVRKEDTDKRQTLTTLIDIGLITNGFRVTAGTYRVTIERLDQKKEALREPG